MKAVETWQKRKIYAIAGALNFVDRNDKENDICNISFSLSFLSTKFNAPAIAYILRFCHVSTAFI